MPATLITIRFSHYCEKARWALERTGIAYREERHVQGIHVLYARRAGGGRTVPVLVADGEVLADSAAILAWVDRRTAPELQLYPPDASEREDVQRLCTRFDEQLGPTGRRLMYVHMLAQRKLTLRFNNDGVPRWEDRAMRWGWPLATRMMTRVLAIAPGVERADEAAVRREFDFVSARLADGRRFLCGERFSAADLTFAALSAAITVPREYGVALPQPELMDERTAALVQRFREHPAGRFALALFADQRRPAGRTGVREIVQLGG
jgi:glutathione S-transferase